MSLLNTNTAGVWSACPGSALQNAMRVEANKRVYEGDVAKKIAAELIQDCTTGGDPGKLLSAKILDEVVDGILVTSEITDAVMLYVKDVQNTIKASRVFGGKNIGVNKDINVPSIHSMCAGTVDCYLYDKDDDSLYVWKYEHGKGLVEVYENQELIACASGVCDLLGKIAPSKIYMTIVQPRGYHKEGWIRTWTLSSFGHLNEYATKMRKAASTALGADPYFSAGPHCKKCPSLVDCGTNRNTNFELIDITNRIGISEVPESSKWYELYLLEKAAKGIKHRVTALRTELENRLKSGEKVHRFKLEPSSGKLEWTGKIDDIVALAKSQFVEVVKPTELITPTQAKAKGFSEAMLEMVSERRPGKMKLVFDDCKAARFLFEHEGAIK